MNYEQFKNRIKEICNNADVTDYELYYSEEQTISTETFKQEISQFTSDTNAGATLRVLVKGKTGSASSELFTEESAKELVYHAMENALSIEEEEKIEFQFPAKHYQKSNAEVFELPSSEQIIRSSLDCQKQAYAKSNKIIDGTQSISISNRVSIALNNSKGMDLKHTYCYDMLFLIAIVSENNEMYDNESFIIGKLKDIDTEKIADKGVSEAISSINPQKLDSGKYNVILSGKTMAALLQTFSSVFSAENVQQGLSLLGNKQNTSIAADCVTLIDDPFYQNSLIQMPFDAEGTPTFCKNIIENGTLKTFLYDIKSAKKDNVPSTGNAVRENYSSPIAIKPYNFYLQPGSISQEGLMQQLCDGIYITNLQGMHSGANPLTGDFSLAAGGYRIENGVKTYPVNQFTVSGNFYSLLKQIICFASNIEFILPKGCTLFGSADTLIHNVSIAGK